MNLKNMRSAPQSIGKLVFIASESGVSGRRVYNIL